MLQAIIKDMSSDTAKENASVVDSSVTEWKHEAGNLDNPESSSFKARQKDASDERRHSCNGVENSNSNGDDKFYETRYFIIKSLNHQNIQQSVRKGIWATQVMNEPVLDEAFHSSGKVILIFSVNMSGFFQGYAQMMSSVGWRRDNVWSQGSGGNNPWGRSFRVEWLQLCDLPFQKTLHLKNPLNDFKPVKISRDCQELPEDIGEALCDLLDEQVNLDGGDMWSVFCRDGFVAKRARSDPSGSLTVPPVHVPWTMAPLLYPSMLHPDQKESQLWGLSADSSSLTEDDFLEMSYEEYLEIHSRSHQQQICPTGSLPPMGSDKVRDDALCMRSSRKRIRSSHS